MTTKELNYIADRIAERLEKKMEEADDRYLTRTAAAEYVGHSESYMRHHPEVPSVKVKGRVLYRKKELREFFFGR